MAPRCVCFRSGAAGDPAGGGRQLRRNSEALYRQLIAKADSQFSAHVDGLKAGKRRCEIVRSLNDMLADLPPERQAGVEARYQELKQAIDGLRELRQIAGKAQLEIAEALNIKQPSVSKIEKQADMHLSTLRSYVEAVGGKLELVVKLPHHPALHLEHLGDALTEEIQPAFKPHVRRRATAS